MEWRIPFEPNRHVVIQKGKGFKWESQPHCDHKFSTPFCGQCGKPKQPHISISEELTEFKDLTLEQIRQEYGKVEELVEHAVSIHTLHYADKVKDNVYALTLYIGSQLTLDNHDMEYLHFIWSTFEGATLAAKSNTSHCISTESWWPKTWEGPKVCRMCSRW